MNEVDLRDAMVEYQAGQAEAFERLYAALAPILRRYHRSMTRDAARAEDLVQETFLRIHRARRTYSPDRTFLPWALAIARHVFLMDRRASARRGRRETQPREELPEVGEPPRVEREIEREALEWALEQIPAPRRESLVLHHLEGLGFREIARRLGVSEGAAKLRSSRGMARLRHILVGGKGTSGGDRGKE